MEIPTLEMSLINCEANCILTWSSTCVITNSTSKEKSAITDTKLYVSAVSLSTQDNANFLRQLMSIRSKNICTKQIFKSLSWSKFSRSGQNFCIIFWKWRYRRSHSNYYLPNVTIKDYNVMIDGKKSFDQPINKDIKTYENIRKVATGEGDD